MRARNSQEGKGEQSTVRKVLGYVSTAIIAAALVAVVIVLITAFVAIGKGETPSVMGYRFYTVLTDSMTPTIKPGDVIISKRVTEKSVKELQKGDIITYISESGEMKGKPVTHRIEEGIHYDEKLKAEVVITRGDKAGARLDDPVRLDQIQSVMVKNSAALKSFYGLFRSGAGFAIIIMLPLGAMLISLVVRLVQAIRHPEEEGEIAAPEQDAEREAKIAEIKAKAIEEYLKQEGAISEPEPSELEQIENEEENEE